MAMSVITNTGAMIALQQLNKTNKSLDQVQQRVTTGLKVNGPRDDASTYVIAQRMRGDISGMQAVKIALETAEATVGVALTAGQRVSDLLIEMKAKTVQANQAGLDASARTALTNDFLALRDQIDTIVLSAEFNGVNLVKDGATDLKVLSTVEGSTITVSAAAMQAITLQFGIPNTDLYTSANAAQSLNIVNSALGMVSDKLAALGSAAKRIEIQSSFNMKLIDILKQGVGNLVDADLAQEAADLQSLQIRQQLGTQALSIANQRPQSLLSLFSG